MFYIYAIINLINNKIYIGKSVNPKTRWLDHKKVALGGKEKYPSEYFAIHAALHKYSIENFKFEIIDQHELEDKSYELESWWIKYLETYKYGYNCNEGGRGSMSPNEETRKKLIEFQNKPERLAAKSKAMKERHLKEPGFLGKINIGNQYTKGRKLSQKEKDNLSKKFKGRYVSNETKLKMSLAQSGDKHSQSKLTLEQVLDIREKYSKISENKKQFFIEQRLVYGVGYKTIQSIAYRMSWNNV